MKKVLVVSYLLLVSSVNLVLLYLIVTGTPFNEVFTPLGIWIQMIAYFCGLAVGFFSYPKFFKKKKNIWYIIPRISTALLLAFLFYIASLLFILAVPSLCSNGSCSSGLI